MKTFAYPPILIMLVAGAAVAGDFWPLHPSGVVYYYDSLNDYDTTQIATYAEGGIQRELNRVDGVCYCDELYVEIAGETQLDHVTHYCTPWIDPEWFDLEPPLTIARADMVVGDQWVWAGTVNGKQALISVEVAAEEEITVAPGTFTALRLEIVQVLGYLPCLPSAVWVDRQLGPLFMDQWLLSNIDGVVATRARTWSTVKGLFD